MLYSLDIANSIAVLLKQFKSHPWRYRLLTLLMKLAIRMLALTFYLKIAFIDGRF